MINKISTNLQQIKLRGIGQLHQRAIIGPKKWREEKGNVQATAGRSFEILKKNFVTHVDNILSYYQVDDKDKTDNSFLVSANLSKEIEASYKKAYLLGLKSSGLTVYQRKATFKKVTLPRLEYKEAEWLKDSIFDKMNTVKAYKGKDYLNRVQLDLFQFYQYGRVMGGPIYSFIYFTCKNHKELVDNNPWPKEVVPEFFPCCNFKIIPKSVSEYRERIIDF